MCMCSASMCVGGLGGVCLCVCGECVCVFVRGVCAAVCGAVCV